MYPLGHIGITVFISTFLYMPAWFVLAGSLLPDAVDKGLYVAGFSPSAHFIGHTIFLGLSVGLIAFIATKRKNLSLAISFGYLMHLIEDAESFIPWFYPFVNYTFTPGPLIAITPFVIFNEVLGGVLLIILFVFKSKLIYFRDKINSWLKALIS
jgi:hypothetical protein